MFRKASYRALEVAAHGTGWRAGNVSRAADAWLSRAIAFSQARPAARWPTCSMIASIGAVPPCSKPGSDHRHVHPGHGLPRSAKPFECTDKAQALQLLARVRAAQHGAVCQTAGRAEPDLVWLRGLRRLVAEAPEPHQVRLAAEPGDLPFGILPRVALRVEHRLARIQFAREQLQRLFVSVRFEGLGGGVEAHGQDAACLIGEPGFEHGGTAPIEAIIRARRDRAAGRA